jgi:hypothetical protein
MWPVLTVLMDVLTDSHQVRRLDVLESGRRRRWTESEKQKIVHESLAGRRLTAATAWDIAPASAELAQGLARGAT